MNISYDAWGSVSTRTTNGVTGTFNYDGLNELVRWNSSNNNQAQWNLYDSSGQRVLTRTYDGSTTNFTVYAFGLEEYHYQYSGSGSSATNTGNTTTTRWEANSWERSQAPIPLRPPSC